MSPSSRMTTPLPVRSVPSIDAVKPSSGMCDDESHDAVQRAVEIECDLRRHGLHLRRERPVGDVGHGAILPCPAKRLRTDEIEGHGRIASTVSPHGRRIADALRLAISAKEPLRELGDGEVLVKVLYVSLDPAMRGWMNEASRTSRRSRSAR